MITTLYMLELRGVARNCTVSGSNPRSIDLGNTTSTSPASVYFSVSCVHNDDDGAGRWDY